MTAIVLLGLALAAPPAEGLRVPDGFEVTEYSGSDLANDITCMTLDPKGRIVVAGRGYIRILTGDKDGRATKAIDVTRDVADSAHGLLWEKDSLYAVVDGGLRRFRIDASGDKAAGPSELIRKLKTGGEHDAHALRRGPDGWLYLLCGNSAGIDRSFATLPTSPIKEPVAGCIVRFTPDFKNSEIVADGFRNPYGFDFDANGELFTYDADNERCVSLPWYEGTRVYHVRSGGRHGWRGPQISETWRCPPYFADVTKPRVDLGRGSPTGVAAYRNITFPSKYRYGQFYLDWTFGRVWHVVNSEIPDVDLTKPFLEATGANGFAPTACVVQPQTGHLFVSVGGRGTRGAVYRIRWTRENEIDPADYGLNLAVDPATGKLTYKRPAVGDVAVKAAYHLNWRDEFAAELPKRTTGAYTLEVRVPALADVRRFRERFPFAVVRGVIESNWSGANASLLQASADLISDLPRAQRDELKSAARTPRAWLTMGFGAVSAEPGYALKQGEAVLRLDEANKALADPAMRLEARLRLDAVRLIQLALGDLTAREHKTTVLAGYTPRRPLPGDRRPDLRALLRSAFPSGDANLDRELSRTLAVLEDDDPAALQKIAARLSDDSDPLDDVHYLIVLSRLRGKRTPEQTKATAESLLALDAKIAARKRNRDRNFPLRIAELHAELAKKDPALNDAILSHDEFGRPDHVVFCRCPGFDRKKAVEVFVREAERSRWFAWNSELVGLLTAVPAERSRPILRSLWERGGLEDAVLPVLAAAAGAEDVPRLLAGLRSPRLETVRVCLAALEKLAPRADGPTALALVRCLRLLPDGREGDQLRKQCSDLLAKLSGRGLGLDKAKWSDWLAATYPDLAQQLGDGVDVAAWRKRLSAVDWAKGDAERGRAVYAKASCAACHSGSQAMGPDLMGVAGRFSRDDLFTAILQPSKDISPRYRTTQIETTDGKTYQGLIVYEAVDGVLLQTGPVETVRVAGDKIESRRVTEVSLMPTGLLDRLSDGEIADLYAHLRSLGRPGK